MLIATFNMKNSYSPSPSKSWIKRADSAVELINKRGLDVIGTQELTARTKKYLESKLEDYIFVGESRGSASISDEYNSILLKKEYFELLGTETYALSNNIYKKGSKFLLDAFPRICTVTHVTYEGYKYLIINTHLDNVFSYNRKLQLEVLSEVISLEKNVDEDIIVMGDFNMHLTGDLEKFAKKNKLVDAVPRELGSSFREFDRKEPIDHIFVSKPSFDVVSSEYDTNKYNGINPSDHYPTIVDISRKK